MIKENSCVVRTQKAVRQAMVDLLSEKGFDQITITELIRRAKISRGTFYAHYSNLSEVMEEIEGELLGEMEKQLKDRGKQAVSPEMVAKHISNLIEQFMQRYGKYEEKDVLFEFLNKNVDKYLELCLQEATVSQREDKDFEMRLHAAAIITIQGSLKWISGQLSQELTYPQFTEEIIRYCSKL